jgi:hypothetical protein
MMREAILQVSIIGDIYFDGNDKDIFSFQIKGNLVVVASLTANSKQNLAPPYQKLRASSGRSRELIRWALLGVKCFTILNGSIKTVTTEMTDMSTVMMSFDIYVGGCLS